ncbi:transporter [Nitrospina sp. 32_T5]|uniref:transporter n=1 Tax=unclassified Nitrospina TaxID=2638683 RepID=UPI003F944AC7
MRNILMGHILATLLLAATPLWAAEPSPIVTDRPGQSDASSVVAPGTLQIETGYFLTHDDDGGHATTHLLPEPLFRLGVLEWLELRFFLDGYIAQDVTGGPDASGFGDGNIGTKFYFWGPEGLRPEFALDWGVALPFGDDEVSRQRYDPFVRLLFTNVITKRFSITYNLGAEWNTTTLASGARETLGAYTYTFSPAYVLTPEWSVFAEVFGSVPMDPADDAHTFNGGVLWLITPDWQFDLSAGVGLNDAANDLFIRAGLSTRWGNLF